MSEQLRPPTEPITVSAALDRLAPPRAGGLKIPIYWKVDPNGVHKWVNQNEEPSLKTVAASPVLISKRLKEIVTGEEWLELSWYRDGRWQSDEVERKVVANKAKIIELASAGFPVTSTNAKDIVDYLSKFEDLNLARLPVEKVTTSLGWQEGGRLGFMLGRVHICKRHTPQIRFIAKDGGDAQTAAAFHIRGSLEEWYKAVQPVKDYPKVLAAFYASLATPLLDPIGAPNFIVDLSSPTSQGKTITLRIAASIWGNPDESGLASVVHGWEVTPAWVDRTAALLRSLPLILDDTKRCKNQPGILSDVIYSVASGSGKGRGTLKGTQESGHWQTILLSTGETPITEYAKGGGAIARVFLLWGPPWGEPNRETGRLVTAIDRSVKRNYGSAGYFFILYLLNRPAEWDKWKKEYQDLQSEYQELAGPNPVANRLANYFATIALAARIAHEALSLPWEYSDALAALNGLWDEIVSESEDSDRASSALEYVFSWAQGHENEFYGRKNGYRPYQGLAGRWDKDWKYIGFFPERLKKILSEADYEYEATLRTWKERGWLNTDNEKGKGRNTKKISVDGNKTRLVVIKQEALQDSLGQG